jgi:DsbC/DsbD-like thiol-disulfide interchange protein
MITGPSVDKRYILIFLLAGLLSLTTIGLSTDLDMFGTGDSSEPAMDTLAQVSSIFSTTAAEPGGTYQAAVVIDMASGWHINSAAPYQDWLIPVQVAFDTVKGLTPSDLVYPAGTDNFMAGEHMSVLGGRIVIFYQITVDADAPDGGILLPVTVTYQPCNELECRPGRSADGPGDIRLGRFSR